MLKFLIGDTDFKIDTKESNVSYDNSDQDNPLVTMEIVGDNTTFDAITESDDSKWSWALYPPKFYITEYPITIDPLTGIATANADTGDLDKYEFAIYMMEHNNITNVKIIILPSGTIEITGTVDVMGEEYFFLIKWGK